MDNDNDQLRRVIIIALLAMLLGSIFYIFGVTIGGFIAVIANYLIALLLYLSSLLAIHRNNNPKAKLMTYMEVLIVFFIILITAVTISVLF